MADSTEGLIQKYKQLLTAVQIHAAAIGQNRCWENDEALYEVAGIKMPKTFPCFSEALPKCLEYLRNQCPDRPSVEKVYYWGKERPSVVGSYVYKLGEGVSNIHLVIITEIDEIGFTTRFEGRRVAEYSHRWDEFEGVSWMGPL